MKGLKSPGKEGQLWRALPRAAGGNANHGHHKVRIKKKKKKSPGCVNS